MVVDAVAGFGFDVVVVTVQFQFIFKIYLKVRLISGGAQVRLVELKEDGCSGDDLLNQVWWFTGGYSMAEVELSGSGGGGW